MAKKGGQPGGNKNFPPVQPDSEQDRFFEEVTTAATDAMTCVEKMKKLPAGPERDAVVEGGEMILRGAEKTAKNIIAGTMAGGVALGRLRAARREFNGVKAMLDGAGAAGIRAAERAAQEAHARREQEERELAEMQQKEDADRNIREARERVARGEGTEEDTRLLAEQETKRIEQERTSIQALFDDTRPTLRAARNAIRQDNVGEAREQMGLLEKKLASLLADYGINSDAVVQQGFDPGKSDILVFYRGRIDDFEREVVALRSQIAGKEEQERVADVASQAERETAERESAMREEIGQQFSARISELDGQVQNVLAMPIETAVELEAARVALDVLYGMMSAHVEAWDAKVIPILRQMGRLEGAWADLVFRQRALREGFQRDGRMRRDALREKKGETAKERWESELPIFELGLAYAEMQVLDARMLRGQKRKEEFESIRERIVLPILEKWRELRNFAPSLSREQIAAGVRTERAAFDGRIKALEERVQESVEADENARPARLQEVVRIWRNTLARTGQLWNPNTDIGDRGVFLEEKYGPGEVRENDAEFAAMVSEGHRADFETLTHTEVFRALRRRGREDQRQRLAREREERMSLPQVPRLDFVRLLEEDAYWDLRNASFWNGATSQRDFRHVLRAGKTLSDDELGRFISDIPAFRKALESLEVARARVTETEDTMLGKRGDAATLEGGTDAAEVLRTIRGYSQWKRRESQAWSKAMNAKGWRTPRNERKRRLHEFFKGYWAMGAQALGDVPPNLRGAIGEWASAETHLRIFGRHAQWVLDQNKGVAVELRKQNKIPQEFTVDVPDEHIELSSTDRAEVDGFAVDVADVGDVHGADEHDAPVTGSFAATIGDSVARFTGSTDADDSETAQVDAERAPETLPTYSSAGGASRTPDAVPTDARRDLLRVGETWKTIQRALSNDVFWNSDVSSGSRATKLAVFRRNGTGMLNNNGLREDRVADFQFALAFTDITDLERRVAEVVAKYAEAAPAATPAADTVRTASEPPAQESPRAASAPDVASVTGTVPPPPRPDVSVPSAPQSASEGIASGLSAIGGGIREASRERIRKDLERGEEVTFRSPRAIELARADATLDLRDNPDGTVSVVAIREESAAPAPRVESAPVRSAPTPPRELPSDPFERFFGGGSGASGPEARPVARTEAPRPARIEPAPVLPSRPAPRGERVLESVAPVSRVENSLPEVLVEASREPHAEERVASWSRSIRNTVGRWFGGAGAESRPAESRPLARETAPTPEVSRRTAGGVMGVLSRFFGPKVFADVPQYLPESFGDANARALLQADILDAMEANSAAMKGVAGDPDRIHAANLDAAQRLDRAIATSTLSSEAKKDMRDRVVALQEKYAERTRENAAARSRELAGLVEQSVRVLEAPGRRGSPALRLLSKLPFGIGTGLAHGVGDFRKRFETAVSRGGDTGMVARVATVFRETWEEAMRNIRGNGSMGSRAMNTAEAVAMIGSAYGVSATVTALEQVLPNLRLLDGGERDAMSRLVAEGRLNVQETVDEVLPRAERVMRRAA